MPSPFPGMDPYLEARDVWPGFHSTLITQLRYLLAPQLAPHYFVDVERRVYLIDEDDPGQRHVVADVSVAAPKAPAVALPPVPAAGSARAPAVLLMAQETELQEPRLVIRTARGRDVVTVIEVLSPTNKTAGSRGRREHLAKRREVMRSPTHLVEIDLLREGVRIPSVQPLPGGHYYVHVSRAAMRPLGEVYAWSVREAAPAVPVPLRDPTAPAVLDLSAAIRLTYDQSRYDVELDYATPPDPPLAPEDASWAAEIVRAGRT